MFKQFCFSLVMLGVLCATAVAQQPSPAPKESDYYKLTSYPIPENISLECGAMEFLPDGRLAVATRFGDIYLIDHLDADPPAPTFTRWASGMHEVLGLAYNAKDGCLYAVQRGEVTRIQDTDKDDVADLFETYCDDWSITGDYHEYAIGSKFDAQGNLFVALCLTGSFTSDVPYRGWVLKVTPDGKAHPFASGIRSPAGLGFNLAGDLFYSDNQGPWHGASTLCHLAPGSFQGHPGGNRWYDQKPLGMGDKPAEPQSGSRSHIEAAKIKQYVPPAVFMVHNKIGQSSSGIQCDFSQGKFGPYAGHLFVGDQHHSNVTRCVLEKVGDRYQGVAIPFASGFGSGVVPIVQHPKSGALFVGGTNRGWGSVGPKPFALDRLTWTGKTPFELYDMKVTPEGFTLTFTEPVDPKTAGDVKSYAMSAFTYIFQAEYGSPEVDATTPTIKSATVAADGKSVRLAIEGRQIGSIHELHLDGVRSAKNAGLLHPVAYYTLWQVPK